ncbi:cytochrome P450 [Aspergillus cavernicola]|uniref:Cytochrome P450 n=1 Tax=Aspergillus cavernicola TaxID=176166 RepID=A0ABR4HY55_9EURO
MLVQQLSVPVTIGAAFGVFAVYVVARCIYDLFFHPLRNIPGPKKAAIWSFYEFYYDVIKDGTYIWEIEKMHQKYGPIVHINSRSLHIHDPEYFNTIYAGGGRKVNKELSAVSGYTFPHSTISTLDHDLHRKRRAIVNPYFSKKAIADIEPAIDERIDVLISRLAEAKGSTVDLACAFSAFTADVVTYHFYGSHANYIGSEDFKYGLKDALTVLLNLYNLTRFLPFPANTLKNLPLPILGLINPNFPLVVSAREDNKKMVLNYINSSDEEKSAMRALDPSVPAQEKTLDRLLDEGETIIFAGIDTTARTIAIGVFHLLNNKEVLMKLRKELEAIAKPDGQQWTTTELEAMPYIGVVQEAIRLTYGLVVRIPRISAQEALQYNSFVIPPGIVDPAQLE